MYSKGRFSSSISAEQLTAPDGSAANIAYYIHSYVKVWELWFHFTLRYDAHDQGLIFLMLSHLFAFLAFSTKYQFCDNNLVHVTILQEIKFWPTFYYNM